METEDSSAHRYLSLQHVNVPSNDLAQARDFYCDRLGLAELPRPAFDVHGIWIAISSEQAIHITKVTDSLEPTPHHFAIAVDALDELVAELATRGVAHRRLPFVPSVGHQAFIEDPDGNTIELIQLAAMG